MLRRLKPCRMPSDSRMQMQITTRGQTIVKNSNAQKITAFSVVLDMQYCKFTFLFYFRS